VTSSSSSLSPCESLSLELSHFEARSKRALREREREREGEIILLKKLDEKLSPKRQLSERCRYIRGGKARKAVAN